MSDRDEVEEYILKLYDQAEILHIDPNKPVRMYVNSADTVFRQAAIYHREGDLERAFVLFIKYTKMHLKGLPSHPGWSTFYETSLDTAARKTKLEEALSLLENLRSALVDRFRLAVRERKRFVEEAAAQEKIRASEKLLLEMKQSSLRRRLSEMSSVNKMDMTPTVVGMLAASTSTEQSMVKIMPPENTMSSIKPVNNHMMLDEEMKDYPSVARNIQSLVPTKPVSEGVGEIARLENGSELRTVNLPKSIVGIFLKLANTCTVRGVEFCGILTGKLSHNVFTITALIIPKQTSTSDTVTMEGEVELWALQESRDLMTLGWIHTHPTQTCFMSSVDIHTHLSYQLSISEAIAIVVAPTRTPNFGIFRLTDPPGLDTIEKCKKRGFHSHGLFTDESSIYCDITSSTDRRKSHVVIRNDLPLEVIDIR